MEAKRSIRNEKQLEDAKLQVRSYAKLLGARYTVIASMKKVWVTSYKDDYSEHICDYTWEDLSNDDVFYSLEKEIGKRYFVI